MTAPGSYRDRREAGAVLAEPLRATLAGGQGIVLALPRGGVPVGREIARALGAELDILVVRKLGAPGCEEYAVGAIAAGGFCLRNREAIRSLRISERDMSAIIARETAELQRREQLYRSSRPAAPIEGRIAIVVDDGLATGFTMRAAIAAVRARGPRQLVVAVPVGAPDACAEVAREADLLVCPLQPEGFQSVGAWYRDFRPTSDDEVRECLAAATRERGEAAGT